MKKWRELYSSLEVMRYSNTLPKPTDAMLNEFEEAYGFKLPKSYRSFIKVFGPGELAWDFRIAAPGYPGQPYTVDLAGLNEQVKGSLTGRSLRRLRDPERIRRLVFFCREQGGDLIGWDPEDIRDPRKREYGIYKYGRAVAAEELADSFAGFIESVCLADENINIPGRDESLGSRWSFDPSCRSGQ